MSVTEQFSTGLTTIMAAAEQWYHRPLRKDAIEELMTMAERMGEAAPAIVINQKKGQMYDWLWWCSRCSLFVPLASLCVLWRPN